MGSIGNGFGSGSRTGATGYADDWDGEDDGRMAAVRRQGWS